MCYICEDQGTVGPNYRAGLKVCREALRKCGGLRSPDRGPKPGNAQDWLSRPKRIWSTKGAL